MIKFFRQIRQNLVMENKNGSSAEANPKVGRYIKYAIGEIVLVVIGILIALQINTSYETSKKQRLKHVYTTNLINDLTKDTIQLNARIKINEERFLKRLDSLIAIIHKPTTNANDIKTMAITSGISGLRTMNTYNDNTFNVLTSTGNIELFDDVIIQNIMELNRLQNVVTGVSDGNRKSYFDLHGSYLELYASRYGENELIGDALWGNVDPLKHAPLYINVLNTQHHSVSRYIELTEDVVAKTEELLNILYEQ